MDVKLKEKQGPFKGHVKCELFDLSGNIVETKEYDNVVCTVTKNAFAAMLNSEVSTFDGKVNYGAIGTDASSAIAANTQLGAEIARVAPETNGRSGAVTTITFYYDTITGIGLLKEFGAFIAGTASANTGFLFDRVNIDVNKTALNSLRITLTITVS